MLIFQLKKIFNHKCDVLNAKQVENKIKTISKSKGPIYIINTTYPKVQQNKNQAI